MEIKGDVKINILPPLGKGRARDYLPARHSKQKVTLRLEDDLRAVTAFAIIAARPFLS